MTLIDTNVILRLLLNDLPEQAEQAKAAVEAGAFTTMEVMAEVVYVLRRVYHLSREEICLSVMRIANDVLIPDYDVLSCAMEHFRTRNLDFVDCVIAARISVRQEDAFSFDKKLMALVQEVKRQQSQ